jgi:Ca2+-binding EF-hand superfamily protein
MSAEEVLKIISDPVVFDQMARELFSKVNTDNNSYVDKYELRMILNEFSETLEIKKPTEADVEDILLGFDADGNCSGLTYDEFKGLLNRLIRQIVNIAK